MRARDVGAVRRGDLVVQWKLVIAAGLAAGIVLGSADPASAYRRHRNHSESGNTEKREKKAAPRTTPLFAIVAIAEQRVSFYGHEGLVERAPVSTGQPGHRTPTGVFSILGKEVFHRSNLYSSAPMPYMQRITWSGVALHSGVLPGYPASHGCIRMPHSFAQKVYGMTKIGQRVLVTSHDVAPIEIVNAKLPVPVMHMVPSNDGPQATNSTPEQVTNVSGDAASQPAANGEMAAQPPVKRMNPVEYAWFMRSDATARVKAATAEVKAAQAVEAEKQEAARAAARSVRAAEAEVEDQEAQLAALARKSERAIADEEDAKKALGGKAPAEVRLAEAQKAAEDARLIKELKDKEFADAEQAAKAAKAEGKDAKEIRAARESAADKEDEMDEARKALRVAEAAAKAAEAQLAAATRRAAKAVEEQAELEASKVKMAEAKVVIEAKIVDARKAVEQQKEIQAVKNQDYAAAEKIAEEAEGVYETLVKNYEEGTRRLEPLSVFISRKTGRLYVRQAFKKVFDVPVTIKDPERPLGTHVYISTNTAADGASLKWSAVSVPDREAEKTQPAKRRRVASNVEDDVAEVSFTPETAAGALNRIDIPEAAAKRLAEMTWVGASVIISDRALSGETGEYTDFIILTNR